MSLRNKLDADMKAAMKARDRVRLGSIRAIRGAVRNKEIEQRGDLDDDGILRVIRGLVKQRTESIEQYRAAGRAELEEQETREREVLEGYLPAAPDAAEIERVVRAVIAEVGAASPKQMGQVMSPALERLGPAADGKQISALVRKLLAESAEAGDGEGEGTT